MPDYVKITKNGLREYSWNGDIRKYRGRRPKKLNVLSCLRCVCKLDKGITVLDIFNIVDQYKLLKIFCSQYSWCRAIDGFHKQAKETGEKNSENIDYLEIGWVCDFYKGEISLNTDFIGIGKTDRYSVSCSPSYVYANLPIVINKQLELNGVKLKRDFTLLDILDAIYFDISFYGGPKEIENFVAEMNCRLEEIKSGKAKTIPLDEVFKNGTL